MAEKLAKICFTEEDKVNCPFYFKIGACRYGDKCARLHHKPVESQTLLLPHMYDNPPQAIALATGVKIPEEHIREVVKHFEEFYEEIFLELIKFGEIEEMHVSDNIGDHMIGNVYVKFFTEEEAAKAKEGLTGRYYAGKLIAPEYSPVTNFREARCKQYDQGTCPRGGYCNFLHLKYLSRSFKKSLFRDMYDEHPEYREKRRKRERELEKSRSRSRSDDDERRSSKKHSRSKSKSRKEKSRHSSRDRKRRHRSRSRSESKERSRSGSNDSNKKSKRGSKRTESEERRAMIERWNQEAVSAN